MIVANLNRPTRHKILIVSSMAPPSPMSGARRIAGLTKFLALSGYEVTVLTSLISGSGSIEGATRTLRTRDLMAGALNWRQNNLVALSGEGAATYDASPSAISAISVPDIGTLTWVPFAIRAAKSLILDEGIDCVITISPPHSTHLVGLALSGSGVPWIADLQDGWCFEDMRPALKTHALRKADAMLERLTARRADAVTAVTAPIAEDLASRLGTRTSLITNGYDPLESETVEPRLASGLLDRKRVSLVYTGRIAAGKLDLSWLTAGVDIALKNDPGIAQRLEIVFAGSLTEAEIQEIELRRSILRHVGHLDRATVLALQRSADALLLLIGNDRPSVATGKLYEYLAAERPIFVIGRGNVAAGIVDQVGAGLAVSVDANAVAEGLEFVSTGEFAISPDVVAASAYSYDAIASNMAVEIERAINSKPRRHS